MLIGIIYASCTPEKKAHDNYTEKVGVKAGCYIMINM